MVMNRCITRHALRSLLFLTLMGACVLARAATINFSGPLLVIKEDLGGAVYSGVPLGTVFTGAIDDVTANGFITDGSTQISFGCCNAAGGLEIDNDLNLDADTASCLNTIADSPVFNAGDTVDGINIEGDELIAGGNRIEIGLSYILDPNAFDDAGLDNFPPNPDDILLVLFFIVEEDGGDIYSALGSCTIPLEVPPPFLRGDCNDDGAVDISDAVCTLSWLFLGGPAPGCLAVTNTNGDGAVDLSDPVYLLSHLFLGGPPPVAPFPECGPGTLPTDAGTCETTPVNC